jgi:hypothetical protein
MKNLMVVAAAIILLSLPTFAERPYDSGNTISNNGLSELLLISPTLFSCTCSCGKNCDGSCSASFEGCGLGDGFSCILNCCRAAPNPGSEECGNVLPMSVGVR